MLNLDEINNTIAELENGNTTFDTCSKLASLYVVRDKLMTGETKVEKELNDILPQYKAYCEVKKKYQQYELPEIAIQAAMKDVCIEIKEFIYTLYSGTDTVEERKQLKEMLKDLAKAW